MEIVDRFCFVCFLIDMYFSLQVFVDQIDPNIVAVTRFNPSTFESLIMISYTAFSWPNDHASAAGKGITIPGVAHSLMEAGLKHK